MALAAHIAEADQWSILRASKAFGMTRQTVRKRCDNANIKPVGQKQGNPVYLVADMARACFAQLVHYDTDGGPDPEQMIPTDRRAHYQAELDRVKLEKELCQVIPVDEVTREMSALCKSVANTLDSLPDMLERECSMSAVELERVQRVIDTLREQLYEAVTGE